MELVQKGRVFVGRIPYILQDDIILPDIVFVNEKNTIPAIFGLDTKIITEKI